VEEKPTAFLACKLNTSGTHFPPTFLPPVKSLKCHAITASLQS